MDKKTTKLIEWMCHNLDMSLMAAIDENLGGVNPDDLYNRACRLIKDYETDAVIEAIQDMGFYVDLDEF